MSKLPSPYEKGSRLTQGFSSKHKAIDVAPATAGKTGQMIKAVANGTVISAKNVGIDWKRSKPLAEIWKTDAKHVYIKYDVGLVFQHFHFANVYVKTGQRVKAGDKLGEMGSTGRSTAVHDHLEVEKNGVNLNPLTYIDIYNTINSNSSNSNFYIDEMLYDKPRVFETTNTVAMNLREEPTTKSKSVAKIAPKTRLTGLGVVKGEVVGGIDNWHHVLYQERLCYVAGKYIKQVGEGMLESAASDKLQTIIKNLEQENDSLEKTVKNNQAEMAQVELEKAKAIEDITRVFNSKIDALQGENSELANKYTEQAQYIEKFNPDYQKSDIFQIGKAAILEELKMYDIKGRWFKFVDSKFKSKYLTSLLKYDWFYILFVFCITLIPVLERTETSNTTLALVFSTSVSVLAQISKFLLTNYDKNKDGKLDIKDTSIV